ncbi:galactose-3-O-sulfotransferase 3 [Elysia marginata]|uniref:Galactose-3-O-sulfotransferase 3 n=1 Tax=Elysia marginata TaxID=1093978 RepID=A0AAV4JES9_9GAST|nr:galactose-3-O-sulfotransferase 3 [Elysia marginata]
MSSKIYTTLCRAVPKYNTQKLVAFTLISCAIVLPYMLLTGYSSNPGQAPTSPVTLAPQGGEAERESLQLLRGNLKWRESPHKADAFVREKLPLRGPGQLDHGHQEHVPVLSEDSYLPREKPESFKQKDSRDKEDNPSEKHGSPKVEPSLQKDSRTVQKNQDSSKLSGSARKSLSGSYSISHRVSVSEKQFDKPQQETNKLLHKSDRVITTATIPDLKIEKSPRLFGENKKSAVRQVVFIKVHKAASSTMQNILLRFAMARNLSVVLPRSPQRTSINEVTTYIRRPNIIEQPTGQSFDILCNHVIYDKQEIANYIPSSAVRVAILRNPLNQALSALEYYTKYFPYAGIRDGYNRYKDDPINGFLQHPEYFCNWKTKLAITYCFVNNRMSMDLGFDTSKDFELSKKNKTKINNFIKSLDNDFDLMLISDYFEESLVLLRRYLSWGWKDIIYVKINVAKHSTDSVWAKKPVMNETAQKTFHQWNIIDIEVYDHFFPLFLKRIRSEPMFSDEVIAFKGTLKRINAFCLDDKENNLFKVTNNAWTAEFTLTKDDCELMSMKEPAIVKMARTRQLERYETEAIL